MEYLDEEILRAKRLLERRKYTTLETGMYAGEDREVSELLFLLGSVPAVSQVMVKEDPDTGKYEISFTVPSTNKFTNNCYPYASRPAEPENFEGLGVVKEQGDKK